MCSLTGHGSPYARFRRALDAGNLTLVRATAAELPHVELGDALRIVWLMREDDQLYERACIRWLGRFCLEAKTATLQDVHAAASSLAAVASGMPGALDRLAALCRDCGISRI